MFLRPPERSPDRPAAVAIRRGPSRVGIREAQAAGAATLQSVADGLNARGIATATGKGLWEPTFGTCSRASRLSPLTAAGRPRARGLHKKARLGLG